MIIFNVILKHLYFLVQWKIVKNLSNSIYLTSLNYYKSLSGKARRNLIIITDQFDSHHKDETMEKV